MSIEIDHEKVAKKLALEIADLKYQLATYSTVVEDMQAKISQQEASLQQYNTRDETNDE